MPYWVLVEVCNEYKTEDIVALLKKKGGEAYEDVTKIKSDNEDGKMYSEYLQYVQPLKMPFT